MMSKFQPFDIKEYCRVYFTFLSQNNEKVTTYYERLQFISDEIITSEALRNAEDIKQRFGFKNFISLYIARTPIQVKEYEAKL